MPTRPRIAAEKISTDLYAPQGMVFPTEVPSPERVEFLGENDK
jgi:hypothetical protein